MARRRKPEEPVREAPAKSLEEELKPDLESNSAPKTETKRPKDAVLGYMREFYGHY